MFKRLLPIALGASLTLTACWSQAPSTVGQMVGTHPQVINLAKGTPRAGFGRMTIQVPVGGKGTRAVQAIGSQRLIVIITKPDGSEVQDENGHDAVYSAAVSSGVATVTLPGLPPTTTSTSGGPSANAYTVTTLIGNWDDSSLPSDYTYAEMAGDGSWAFDYGTRSEGKFTFDEFGSDLIPSTTLDGSTEAAEFPNGRLQRSGFGRADITSGVQTTITVSNFEHFITNFVNSTTFDAAKARANVTSLTGLVADDAGKVRVRHPGLALNTIDDASGRKLRFVVSLQDDTTKSMSSPPAMSIKKYDPAGGTYSATLTAPSFSAVLTSTANAGFSSLNSEMAYADADLTAVNTSVSASNIVDFEFDLGSAMAGATVRLYALPLGTNGIMSGAFAPSIFE